MNYILTIKQYPVIGNSLICLPRPHVQACTHWHRELAPVGHVGVIFLKLYVKE